MTNTFLRDDATFQAIPIATTSVVGMVKPNGTTITVAGDGTISSVAALTSITNALSGDVSLNNTGTYFDGPSCAQGSVGTWFASGTVTVVDTVAASFNAKLWDGTTVVASARTTSAASNFQTTISLSGVIVSPVSNIRISVNDPSSVNGLIKFNASSNSKDSTLTVVRLA